jgi:hypothetical protein
MHGALARAHLLSLRLAGVDRRRDKDDKGARHQHIAKARHTGKMPAGPNKPDDGKLPGGFHLSASDNRRANLCRYSLDHAFGGLHSSPPVFVVVDGRDILAIQFDGVRFLVMLHDFEFVFLAQVPLLFDVPSSARLV